MKANGFLNLTKPKGLTSHDCIVKLRRILKTKKIGHAGTLDPMATGVLPIAVNRATRFIQYLDKKKAYEGTIRFGVITDSDDVTGNVIHEKPAPWLSRDTIEKELMKFVGVITQRPPLISALKKDGERLYFLARTGNANIQDVPLRQVLIESIAINHFQRGEYPEVNLTVSCSEGTYIRSIARECGENLLDPESFDPVGGTLSTLHRIQSGGFNISTRTLQLQPIENGLEHLPKWFVDPITESRWLNGMTVRCPILPHFLATLSWPSQCLVAVYKNPNIFLGITILEKVEHETQPTYAVTGTRTIVNPI